MADRLHIYTRSGLLTAHGLRTGRKQGTNGRRAESSIAWMYLEGDVYVVRWLGSPHNIQHHGSIGDARLALLACPGVERLSKAWDREVDERHLLPPRPRPQH